MIIEFLKFQYNHFIYIKTINFTFSEIFLYRLHIYKVEWLCLYELSQANN